MMTEKQMSLHWSMGLTLLAATFLVITPLAAQTSTAGAGIDVELINPSDGSNTICVQPNQNFTVRLWLHPGTGTTSCTPACGSSVSGGTANIATAVVDIDFDQTAMNFVSASNNPSASFAAVDGLVQDNSTSARVGWALAGDWTPDADTNGTLATPCAMKLLDTSGWLAEFNFTAGASPSSSIMHLRQPTDTSPFALSFADICGSDAFTQANSGIDEVIDATIYVSAICPAGLFSDGFENGNTSAWSNSRR